MTRRRLSTSLLAGAFALVAAPAWATDLAGLWEGRRSFTPPGGTLVVERIEGGWRGEIAGRAGEVAAAGDGIEVDIPGRGLFRGRLGDGGAIAGHWIQPRSATNGLRWATPVALTPAAPGRWTGPVEPWPDELTLYLPVTRRDDGSWSSFLRNPERNQGVFLDLDRVELDGEEARFVGRFFGREPERKLATGRYDAGWDRLSIRLHNRGGTFDLARVPAGGPSDLWARGVPTPPAWRYRPPLPGPDGWPVGTLADAGIDPEPIRRMIAAEIDPPADSVHDLYVHAALIARRGVLVLDEYFHGFHRELPHDSRSASKSWTSVLAGAVMHSGADLALDTPVWETVVSAEELARVDHRKRAITLEHLLTMSSGLACDDRDPDSPGGEDAMQEQSDQPDWHRYTLDLPVAAEPGASPVYCSGGSNLVGAVLAAVTGERLEELFARLVAEPLELGRYHWPLAPNRVPYLGGGAHWLPRDFLKLGQLLLARGAWKGRRVLSEELARASVTHQVELRDRSYGYLWWRADYPWRNRTVTAFFAGGNGGQIVAGIPELDLVVAFQAGNYSDRVLFRIQEELIPEYILPAVR